MWSAFRDVDADSRYWRRQPLLFGQVREDANVERWLLQRQGAVNRAVVIASAGCTALSLADCVGERLDAVDINPSQIALTELKIAALCTLGDLEVKSLFAGPAQRTALNATLSPAACKLLATLPSFLPGGLHNAGRVDRLLGVLRALLFRTVHSRRFIEDFLGLDAPEIQRARFDREWDTRRWRVATRVAFNRWSLGAAFGSAAAARLPRSFAACIRDKVRDGLCRFPCARNGYAWQSFLGRYPAGVDAALPSFLQAKHLAPTRLATAKIRLETADIHEWLTRQAPASVDFFALSNILELSRAASSADLLREVSRVASPGATVCLRAILPVANPLERFDRLRLDRALSEECAHRDRSLICNHFLVYVAG